MELFYFKRFHQKHMHVRSPNIRNRSWVWRNDYQSTIQEMFGYTVLLYCIGFLILGCYFQIRSPLLSENTVQLKKILLLYLQGDCLGLRKLKKDTYTSIIVKVTTCVHVPSRIQKKCLAVCTASQDY